jgi:hypothetical protein
MVLIILYYICYLPWICSVCHLPVALIIYIRFQTVALMIYIRFQKKPMALPNTPTRKNTAFVRHKLKWNWDINKCISQNYSIEQAEDKLTPKHMPSSGQMT